MTVNNGANVEHNNLGPYSLNNVYCGDCAELTKELPDECIDMTIASPPYDPLDENLNVVKKNGLRNYNGYSWSFTAVASQLWRVTKPGGVVVWVVGDATVNGSETGSSFRQALHFMSLGFRLHDTMIYQRERQPLNHNRYDQHFEYMFVFSKGSPRVVNLLREKSRNPNGRTSGTKREMKSGRLEPCHSLGKPCAEYKVRGNIWLYHTGKGSVDTLAHEHPAIFTEALARDHILSWSRAGDLVMDCFMGSGTTAKMCIETGRHWLGFEISEEYCQLARRRVVGARVPLPGLMAAV